GVALLGVALLGVALLGVALLGAVTLLVGRLAGGLRRQVVERGGRRLAEEVSRPGRQPLPRAPAGESSRELLVRDHAATISRRRAHRRRHHREAQREPLAAPLHLRRDRGGAA